jgi:hypothetical protein
MTEKGVFIKLLPDSVYTAEQIQERFRDAEAHVPDDEMAQKIADALPVASLATGWSQRMTFMVALQNRQDGAIERLLLVKRKYDLKQKQRAVRAELLRKRQGLKGKSNGR